MPKAVSKILQGRTVKNLSFKSSQVRGSTYRLELWFSEAVRPVPLLKCWPLQASPKEAPFPLLHGDPYCILLFLFLCSSKHYLNWERSANSKTAAENHKFTQEKASLLWLLPITCVWKLVHRDYSVSHQKVEIILCSGHFALKTDSCLRNHICKWKTPKMLN